MPDTQGNDPLSESPGTFRPTGETRLIGSCLEPRPESGHTRLLHDLKSSHLSGLVGVVSVLNLARCTRERPDA